LSMVYTCTYCPWFILVHIVHGLYLYILYMVYTCIPVRAYVCMQHM